MIKWEIVLLYYFMLSMSSRFLNFRWIFKSETRKNHTGLGLLNIVGVALINPVSLKTAVQKVHTLDLYLF